MLESLPATPTVEIAILKRESNSHGNDKCCRNEYRKHDLWGFHTSASFPLSELATWRNPSVVEQWLAGRNEE
jgi:hypothetical protein